MKYVLAVLWLFMFAGTARADGIIGFDDDHPFRHHMLVQVADYLEDNSAVPISWEYAKELSHNILVAQRKADLDQSDSLYLSELCVLRALGLEAIYGYELAPIVWSQSNIATDDRASATLTPSSIDFGNVQVVTPEPSTLTLMGIGFSLLAGASLMRKRMA